MLWHPDFACQLQYPAKRAAVDRVAANDLATKGATAMPAEIHEGDKGAAAATVLRPPVGSMVIVLAGNPAWSSFETVRGACQATAFAGWPVELDEEPTWEDAEWQ